MDNSPPRICKAPYRQSLPDDSDHFDKELNDEFLRLLWSFEYGIDVRHVNYIALHDFPKLKNKDSRERQNQ